MLDFGITTTSALFLGWQREHERRVHISIIIISAIKARKGRIYKKKKNYEPSRALRTWTSKEAVPKVEKAQIGRVKEVGVTIV